MNKTQAEALTILQEECAELIQAISKIFRHGEASVNPLDKIPILNVDHMLREMGDVSTLISIVMFAYGFNHNQLKDACTRKVESLQNYSKIFDKMMDEYTPEEFMEFFQDFSSNIMDELQERKKTPKKKKSDKVFKNELN